MSEYMLMLNNTCNLHCSYCFAQETMGASSGEMSLEAFRKAVDFGVSAPKSRMRGIGIIGGEPTIHSHFKEMMNELIEDTRVDSVDVFTNGTTLTKCSDTFIASKMHVLVNVNSPEVIGQHTFDKVVRGIDALFQNNIPLERIGLGLNIYDPNLDYSFFLSLVDRYNMDSVRISVSVPENGKFLGNKRFSFFSEYRDIVHNIVQYLINRGTVPRFDCNKIPPCILEGEEQSLLKYYQNSPKSIELLMQSNYLNGLCRCNPSIVVDQNLDAIRCFALSEKTRCSINKFENLPELRKFYETTIDCYGYVADCTECSDCKHRKETHCMGGCLNMKDVSAWL